MSTGWPYQDRRGMFQPGREVHEPARRSSGSSETSGSVVEAVRKASISGGTAVLEKTTSSTSTTAGQTPRRRSSAGSGMFAGLTNTKRGSQDYGERRNSHTEQESGGALSGWYNKTFKGVQGAQGAQDSQNRQDRRGVME